ncbi:DUF4307 domain-containing protein [Aestuariimicrobium ganziense]|uniref:DUF4307 domain-containing protein n=1 Tax=Aestuariimicrobium ganziense TaxID=2773677 RepID=UPI001944210C|nr:DUF4307 domain-containing protein [Aestuariimicrobium ganziense]
MTEDERRIAERYPSSNRRRLLVPLVAVLAIALAAWILWAGLYRANPGITGQLHSFRVVDNHLVEVAIVVHRPDPKVAGECVVQAQSTTGEIVGEMTVPVPAGGEADTTHQVELKTYLRATTAILKNCRTL